MKGRRLQLEMPHRSFERLVWCREQSEAPTFIAVIRRALQVYEAHLKLRQPVLPPDQDTASDCA